MTATQDNLTFSVSTPLGKDALILRSLSGHEEMFGLYSFHLEMEASSSSLDASSVIGKAAGVTLQTPSGTSRYFHGRVARFIQGPTDGRVTLYWAELVPWTWMLTLSSDCRIFQNKSVPDIISAVCSDLGFTDLKKSLKKSYTPREYCVQYRETAYDFICRLMAEEGIFFFFEHESSKHTMVLADDASAHSAAAGLDSALYQTPFLGQTRQRGDVISSLQVEHAVTTGKVAYDDYNFETPSTQLFAKVDGSGSTMRRYDYPGLYAKKTDGESYAALRMEAYELPALRITGESTIPALVPGATMTVSGHPRDDVNAEWVLLSVRHQISQRGCENSFQAFPKDTPFRPWPHVPRPLIAGTQTATVVGKSGEEIWTDSYGRIKVQFHWDQEGTSDENSSCWVRVAQGWAGKSWGAWFLPRIGQEVVVSFLEGNPDRPLVTGSVYNAEQTVPYTLPGEQTKSTIKSDSSKGSAGYNELRFEDKKDSEEVYLQAQKDMNVLVKNQRETTIDKANDLLTLNEGSRTTTIKKGDETLKIETGSRTKEIKTDETVTIEGKSTETITGDESHTNKADFTHKVSGNYTLTIDGDLVIKAKSITIQSTGSTISTKSATATNIEAGTAMELKSGTTFTAKGGTDATLEAAMNLNTKGGVNATHKAGVGLTLDGGVNLDGKAGAQLTMKGSAMGTFDGGGMAMIKGGLIKMG
ncbi:type VI secretion system Vgr family protein [Insolitispirillum peregrinum]|uniref:Type VI secretion system secreted protein VgrG n=1 Tax=Insolitispirillum peregrinum TaxID=80876 RepID=A0A1N7JGU4_9PROT|nr:type VI secretion system tip protein VgrG [Insolitispirillum peregrinum]SIS48518.1 type VI secretion system secreted protein VgrG [Insolitispirillum peregrinum]